jgi:hypothetical protein
MVPSSQVQEERGVLSEAARLYCLCERLNNEERAMIACSICRNWCVCDFPCAFRMQLADEVWVLSAFAR